MVENNISLNFHHIGLATKDLEKELEYHKMLGFDAVTDFFVDPEQKVSGIFVYNNGTTIEILQPLNEGSPINSFVRKGNKMYHQAYTCTDIDYYVNYLKKIGAKLVSPPKKSVAFNGNQIAFLLLPTLMLVELIELNIG